MNGIKAIAMAGSFAAPLGLDADGETAGYKRAAPTELMTWQLFRAIIEGALETLVKDLGGKVVRPWFRNSRTFRQEEFGSKARRSRGSVS